MGSNESSEASPPRQIQVVPVGESGHSQEQLPRRATVRLAMKKKMISEAMVEVGKYDNATINEAWERYSIELVEEEKFRASLEKEWSGERRIVGCRTLVHYIGHYLLNFLSPQGNLKRYITGKYLKSSSVDNTMNTFVLVNALISTIPFSLLQNINNDYWQALQGTLSDNGCGDLYAFYYANLRNSIMATMYCSIIVLVISVFYFILRPVFRDNEENKAEKTLEHILRVLDLQFKQGQGHGEAANIEERQAVLDKVYKQIQHDQAVEHILHRMKFRAFWDRCRYVCLLCFILTVTAVIALFSISYLLYDIYSITPSKICRFENVPNSIACVCFASLAVVFSILMMA